jgi:23S rRNA (cytidine1920-2'-O)/16S rRNA (cytidine1409-2'-O)-methyltransferase
VKDRRQKDRIDKLLVDRQILEDENTAQRWIMSGSVLVNGQVVTKVGLRIDIDSDIIVRGLNQKYASRGGYKLEAALEAFHVSVAGKVVLDAGAAAGGFTSCLLQHCARLVYAVDVGFGQMKGSLSANPSVRNMERTNISDVHAQDFDPPIELAVVDLSYLSLTKAIPILMKLFRNPVTMICLIKPLFEGVPQLHKNNVTELERALDRVNEAVHAEGLVVANLMVSPVVGTRGTIEFPGLFVQRSISSDGFDALRNRVIQDAKDRFPDLIEPG